MSNNLIPLGESVYAQVTTNVDNEALKTRLTDCWATPTSGVVLWITILLKFIDQTDATQFQLLQTSCPNKDWVTIDDTANGASSDTSFSFQSFRFPG